VVDIARCLVLDGQTQHELALLRENPPRGQGEILIRGYDKQVEVAGRRLRVGPKDFFQANRPLWESWFANVVTSCGAGALALELYAGVGFYTFGLEERFSQVIAVERGSAARSLSHNSNARVVRASAESWLPLQVGRLTPDMILLNPPRTGCDGRVIDATRAMEPARLVYVSCDPMTMARDVSRLGAQFQLTRLLLLDALPQTHHVEAVVVLEHIDIYDPTSVKCTPSTGVSSAGK
jgi:23S rRNA (uracil1939-C5)-methyltransferase